MPPPKKARKCNKLSCTCCNTLTDSTWSRLLNISHLPAPTACACKLCFLTAVINSSKMKCFYIQSLLLVVSRFSFILLCRIWFCTFLSVLNLQKSIAEMSISVYLFAVGPTLQMASCPRVAPPAGMERRTGKMDPQHPLLRPTQSTQVTIHTQNDVTPIRLFYYQHFKACCTPLIFNV